MESGLIKQETQPQPPLLSEKEQKALGLGMRAQVPRASPEANAKFFELFLMGRTCEEIQRLNTGWSLAQVVLARVEGEWDKQKVEYQTRLLSGVRERVMQAQLETTMLLADILTAQAKFMRPKIDRYVQTGDESELGGIQLGGVKNLKETVEMLLKATGQDVKKVKVEGDVNHHNLPAPFTAVPLTSEQAEEVLRRRLQEGKQP